MRICVCLIMLITLCFLTHEGMVGCCLSMYSAWLLVGFSVGLAVCCWMCVVCFVFLCFLGCAMLRLLFALDIFACIRLVFGSCVGVIACVCIAYVSVVRMSAFHSCMRSFFWGVCVPE